MRTARCASCAHHASSQWAYPHASVALPLIVLCIVLLIVHALALVVDEVAR